VSSSQDRKFGVKICPVTIGEVDKCTPREHVEVAHGMVNHDGEIISRPQKFGTNS